MEERPVPTEVAGTSYAPPPPARVGGAYPPIDSDLEKDFGITLAEEDDKLADLRAHAGAGWGPHGGPGEPEDTNGTTPPPWLRESSGYAIQPGSYEGQTSLEVMGDDRFGSVSASVYSSKKDPWERSDWTCFKTRRRRIGCCMCCLMSFLIISGFAVGFYIQIAALISEVNLRVQSVDIVDACKQPMTLLLSVTVNNPSWLVVDVSRLVLTLRDSSSGQGRIALTVRLQEGITISVARWATTSVVVPVDVYPGDSFKLNWDVGTDGSSPAGGGMGNLGLLEGYESNLGVDLRLLFMGDVPLSYSFEQSLGNIWSTQGGSSSPVQSELSPKEVECTTKCIWTTFPDECCNMLDGWGFSVSQINFDLVSFIDVIVEWKLYSEFIKMHKTPNISTVIVPLDDPRDAVEFHIGKHQNGTNVTIEDRDSIGRFRLLMFEKNGVEMLRKLAHEPSSSDRWVLRFQESQLSSGSPNDTCALQVALANVTATFRVSDISQLASSTLPGAGRRDSGRDPDDAHQHLRDVPEREGWWRRAVSTKIDFDSLFDRLQLDYGGYTDPEASESENGTSNSNEFKFIVSFTSPLPEGRFSANTPTVWAGIAPTPVEGTAVQEGGDSPMARVGVQATRFSMVPGERQELVMLGDFLEPTKIGTYFVEPMINGLFAKLRIKKVTQLHESFLSLSVNGVLDGVDFQLSTGLVSPMRSILNYLKMVQIVESPYPSKDLTMSLRIGRGIPKAWGQIPLVTMRHWIGDTAHGSAKVTQVVSEAGTADDLEVLLTLDDALSMCNPILSSIFFGTRNSVKIQLTIGQLEMVTFDWNIPTSFLSTVPVLSYDAQSTVYYKEETCGVSSGRVLGRFCNPFASSLSFMMLQASGRLQLEGGVDMGGWAHTLNETTSQVASIGDCIPLNASQPIGNSTSSVEQQNACRAARLSNRPLSLASDAVTVGGVICTCKAGIGKCTDPYPWRDDAGDERWQCVAAATNVTNITLCRI